MNHESTKPSIPVCPEWTKFQAGLSKQEYATCMLLRSDELSDELYVGWRTKDGKRTGFGGCVGGPVDGDEPPRETVKRLCLQQAGVDLTGQYPIYQGAKEFEVKGEKQKIHLFICFLKFVSYYSPKELQKQHIRGDGQPSKEKFDALRNIIPKITEGSRFDEWEAIPKDRWFQTQSAVGPVLKWGLEILLYEPPPYEEETVPIQTAGHLKDLVDEKVD